MYAYIYKLCFYVATFEVLTVDRHTDTTYNWLAESLTLLIIECFLSSLNFTLYIYIYYIVLTRHWVIYSSTVAGRHRRTSGLYKAVVPLLQFSLYLSWVKVSLSEFWNVQKCFYQIQISIIREYTAIPPLYFDIFFHQGHWKLNFRLSRCVLHFLKQPSSTEV